MSCLLVLDVCLGEGWAAQRMGERFMSARTGVKGSSNQRVNPRVCKGALPSHTAASAGKPQVIRTA